jgi:hypothetical protein
VTPAEARSQIAAALGSFQTRTDAGRCDHAHVVAASAKILERNIAAWEATSGPPAARWEEAVARGIAELRTRAASPGYAPPVVDNQPTKWARISEMERKNAQERELLGKKRSA